MIAHLRGREAGARALRVDGPPGRVDRARVSPQRRVHPRPVVPVPRHASRTGAARRPRPDRTGRGRRRDRARHQGHRPRVPVFSRQLYRALGAEDIRHRRRVRGSAHAPPALARLRARASRLAVAADRVREGRRVRGARHRTPAPALAALPRSRREHAALFPSQAAGRARGRPRASSSTSIRDTTPTTALHSWGDAHRRPLESARGARPRPSRSWPSPGLRKEVDRARTILERLGQKPPARPSPDAGTPVKKSPGSSRRSFKARSGSSRSSAACRPP